jgi:hypothetical protein
MKLKGDDDNFRRIEAVHCQKAQQGAKEPHLGYELGQGAGFIPEA